MKVRKRIISIILLLLLLCSYSTSIYAEGIEKTLPSGIKYEAIGGKIEGYVNSNKETTAGMAVTVLDRDSIIYKNSFGYTDKEKGYAVGEETVFEWGSVSKLLVWTSVMQLWEQGKIDLEADIKTYLPEGFLNNLSYEKPITMINLMNHNAGFQDMLSNLFVQDIKNVTSLEEALKAHKPKQVYEPGTVTAYSNWSSALAGYIVERISGMSYSEYVNKNIFKPLVMEHTAIAVDQSDNPWVSNERKKLQCYTGQGKLIPQCHYYIPLYPAGACIGTISDLTTFVQAILPKEGKKSPLFKKSTTLKEMLSPTAFYGATSIPRNCHGYWTQEFGVSVVGHGGNTAGSSSNVLFNMESGVAVIVMTNQKYENIYTNNMLELIFGNFKKSKYANYNRTVTKDFFMNARTIIKGPLSVKSILDTSKNSEKDLETFWVYSNKKGISKIEWAYNDLLQVSRGKLIFTTGILFFMVAGVLYSFVTLTYGMAVKLRKARKKSLSNGEYPFRKWSYIACGLELLLATNIALLFYQVASFQPISRYIWQIGFTAVLGILMVMYIIYLIIFWRRLECCRKEKFKYIATAVFMLISIVFILYYDMYKFWLL